MIELIQSRLLPLAPPLKRLLFIGLLHHYLYMHCNFICGLSECHNKDIHSVSQSDSHFTPKLKRCKNDPRIFSVLIEPVPKRLKHVDDELMMTPILLYQPDISTFKQL